MTDDVKSSSVSWLILREVFVIMKSDVPAKSCALSVKRVYSSTDVRFCLLWKTKWTKDGCDMSEEWSITVTLTKTVHIISAHLLRNIENIKTTCLLVCYYQLFMDHITRLSQGRHSVMTEMRDREIKDEIEGEEDRGWGCYGGLVW